MGSSTRLPAPAWLALGAGLLVAGSSAACLDRGELQCEEAVARLVACCPDVDRAAIQCDHLQTGCGEVFPEIGVAQARCIRDASCADLSARGLCGWAASIGATTPVQPSACP